MIKQTFLKGRRNWWPFKNLSMLNNMYPTYERGIIMTKFIMKDGTVLEADVVMPTVSAAVDLFKVSPDDVVQIKPDGDNSPINWDIIKEASKKVVFVCMKCGEISTDLSNCSYCGKDNLVECDLIEETSTEYVLRVGDILTVFRLIDSGNYISSYPSDNDSAIVTISKHDVVEAITTNEVLAMSKVEKVNELIAMAQNVNLPLGNMFIPNTKAWVLFKLNSLIDLATEEDDIKEIDNGVDALIASWTEFIKKNS